MLSYLSGERIKHWDIFITYSIGFGLLTTSIGLLLAKRTARKLGLNSLRQLTALREAFNDNVPPKDNQLLSALPMYLLQNGQQIDKLRNSYRRDLILFSTLATFSLFRDIRGALLFLFFVALSMHVHKGLDAREKKIQAYCATLEKQGIKIIDKIEDLEAQQKLAVKIKND